MVRRNLASTFALAAMLYGIMNDSAMAGAWLRNESQSEIIFSNIWTGAKQRFDGTGKPLSIGRFSKLSAQAIAEYGLTSDVTLIAGLTGQQKRFSSFGIHQVSNNLGGLAGARVKIWSDNQTILSFQTTIEIASEQQKTLFQARRFDPPATVDIRLLLGHSFTLYGTPAFADLQLGYRWRGSSHPDDIRVDLTLGIRPASKTLLLLQSLNSLAVERDKLFQSKPTRQHKLQASLVYELTQSLSVQAGGFMSIAGQESLRERGMLLALWWKL